MAMHEPDKDLTLHQIMMAADRLPIEERGQLLRHLELRSWDEAWDRLAKEVNTKRVAQGLPPVTDAEIHAEIDSRRSPEDLEALKYDIQKAIDSLDRGEGIPAEQVFADLKNRYKNFKKAAT